MTENAKDRAISAAQKRLERQKALEAAERRLAEQQSLFAETSKPTTSAV